MTRQKYLTIAVATLLLVATLGASVVSFGVAHAQDGPTVIDSCTTITEPGEYRLGDDIRRVSEPGCIRIAASDVVLDGDGNRLQGTWEGNGVPDDAERLVRESRSAIEPRRTNAAVVVAPLAANAMATQTTTESGTTDGPETDRHALTNVTVTGLDVSDWFVGVSVRNASSTTIRDVEARENGYGVVTLDAPDTSIRTSEASRNAAIGIFAVESNNSTVRETESSRNEFVGLLFAESDDATVTNSETSNNGLDGTSFHRSAQSTFEDSVATRNDQSGVNVTDGRNTTIRDAVASNNGEYGVLVRNSPSSQISDSTVRGNGVGIAVFDSPRTRLRGNAVSGNDRVNILIR